jgi:ACT domain-containing protein
MNKGGRPTVMTPETIDKLEEAFSNGATDQEAIFLANISKSTFYDYCQANPEFSERTDALKEMVKYQARKNVVEKIREGDIAQSNWYLERKAKNEFSTRQENTGAEGKDLIPDTFTPDEKTNLLSLLNDSRSSE